jgi:hypothetical protein
MRIEGEYGISVIAGPDRGEDPSKWKPETVKEGAVCKRYRWTVQDLNRAIGARDRGHYGFPPHDGGEEFVEGWGLKRSYTVRKWKLQTLLAWEDRIREVAAQLPKR